MKMVADEKALFNLDVPITTELNSKIGKFEEH